ncbi:hypothetical protein [Zavarzinia sp.]|uniref:hypothetical protein n=1 Tax=Zavarzinia sp. TaxID=2027920 RepID=UPI003568510D
MSSDFEPGAYQPPATDSRLPAWAPRAVRLGAVGLAVLLAVSALVLWYYVFNFALIGLVVLVLVAGVGGLIGLLATLVPFAPAGDRRRLRLPVGLLLAFVTVWGLHIGALGDSLALRETMAVLADAKDSADAQAKLKALAADNRYAAFHYFLLQRTAQTLDAVKGQFDQVPTGQVPWDLSFDPADKQALQALRSKLLDIDVILSGIPDRVAAAFKKEREDIQTAADRLELSRQFRASMEAKMSQRQTEYVAFYVAFAGVTRKAASDFGKVIDALLAGKATKGADGKFVYGDDKTKAAVEAALAELARTKQALAKFPEVAKALEQRYIVVGR